MALFFTRLNSDYLYFVWFSGYFVFVRIVGMSSSCASIGVDNVVVAVPNG